MNNELNYFKEMGVGNFHAKHGCAWFEENASGHLIPHESGGWYSISGKEPVRFKSWRDLPVDIVWWTNLTRHQAWSLGRLSTFKEGSLFGPEWDALMIENSRFGNKENLGETVRAWSEIFARCAECLSNWASKYTPDKPWDWGDGVVSDVLAQRLGFSGEKTQEPQPILKAAYVDKIEIGIPSRLMEGKRKILLAYPRVDHVKRMWASQYPSGEWSEVNSWPVEDEDKAKWVKNNIYPLLIRVKNIEWRDGHEGDGMLWLGMRGRRFQAADFEPIWLTGEEFKVLNTFAKIEADYAYQADGWTSDELLPGWALSSEEPLVGLSIVQSLLSMSLFDAAASPARDPKKRKKADCTARAIWWRANDRMRCFRAALEFQRKGWPVLNFGNGQITILFDPKEKVEPLIERINENNLLMPALLAARSPLKMDADHSNLVHVNRWIKEVGGHYPLLNVDRLVAPWSGKSSKLKEVLEEAVKKLTGLPAPNNEWKEWWGKAILKQAQYSVERVRKLKNNN